MTKGEFMSIIVEGAKRYVKADAMASIKRSKHMNDYDAERGGVDNNNALIEAAIVDLINFMGMEQGLDFALYTKDLKEAEQCVRCHKYFEEGKPTCECK